MIVSAVTGIDEEKTLSLVQHGFTKGIDPFVLLEDVRTGLELVGTMYNQGKYFLADLIMAAEIYKHVQEIVLGDREGGIPSDHPQVVFGTVEKDIHDIGKNIAIATMRHFGLRVLDLGVNIPPRLFVQKMEETGAPILCMSGLISDAYDSMKKTVLLLKKSSLFPKTKVIIGGLVNEQVCSYTGAHYWVKNCSAGTELCLKIFHEKAALSKSGS
ncbi:hypothetical protein DCMF_10985 [Candidatus Formimonas warabiya]|uniref:B12-binding domain-containing protein n=2 Tax=Formimonas warabiya TaxID=1761012 RepID=A0A3G1L1P3_FORW1|nr:hypothetical protein DCMF_10985 [Candidatus Formimonas warabiya]